MVAAPATAMGGAIAPIRAGAVLFDAYGTLFDLGAAVARAGAGLAPGRAAALAALWRAKQLEYSWVFSLAGPPRAQGAGEAADEWRNFWALTGDALDFALAAQGLAGEADLRAALLAAFRRLDAYPDAAPALRDLRRRGLRTAILSNGSAGMLADAVAAAGLEDLLDAVVSVDAVRIYKPSPRVYALAASVLDLPPEQLGFVSANAWDAAGAAAFGFGTVRLDRVGQPDEYGLAARVPVAGSLAAAAALFEPA